LLQLRKVESQSLGSGFSFAQHLRLTFYCWNFFAVSACPMFEVFFQLCFPALVLGGGAGEAGSTLTFILKDGRQKISSNVLYVTSGLGSCSPPIFS
jgi:hypothetical protein